MERVRLSAVPRLATVLSLVLGLSTTGCVSFTARALPSASQAPPEVMKEVRVTLKSSAIVYMTNASIHGDSLLGQSRKQPYTRTVVPLADIAELSTPKTDRSTTIALLFLLSAVGAVVLAASSIGPML